MSDPNHILRTLLAPQGIKTVTTGGGEVSQFLERRFGSTDPDAIEARWAKELDRVSDARAVLIGLPMDAGAGFERGSFKGPLGIRTALLAEDVYDRFDEAGVVDLGDVFVNPHIIDDSYYTDELLQSVRDARGRDDALPVAPHSALRAVLEACRSLNPGVRFLVLGGDHSLSRVPVEYLTANDRNSAKDLGVLHFDAHTDLLDMRDGVPYNFATWAHHANDAIGRGCRLVQIGIRVSGRSRQAWERELDLRQIRMDEVTGRSDEEVADEIVQTFHEAGVTRLYVSNDIDATDPTYAASTGTMEVDGLMPDLITAVLQRVATEFDVLGSDVVEVAPPLKWHVPGEPARTIRTACRYVLAQLDATLASDLSGPFDDLEPAPREVVAKFPPLA